MSARPILVTGAAGGIGASVVRLLAEAGHPVAAADLDRDAVARASTGLQRAVLPVALDVTDADSVRTAVAAAVEAFGGLGGVVNNAGWMEPRPLDLTADDFLRKVIAINLEGVLRVCREAVPALREYGSGRIVNVASDGARAGMSNTSAYSAAKGGVLALTRCLALELARDQITVNCVSPGPTDTPMLRATAEHEAGADIVERLARTVPLRRIGTPDDVGEAIRYFCSDGAAYVTGQTLSVSGGLVRG